MASTTRRMLYQLLYDALLEIRAEGYAMHNPHVFHLADLFHNFPFQLERMERGESSPDEVMRWLQARARDKGADGWLEHRVDEDAKYAGDSGLGEDTSV